MPHAPNDGRFRPGERPWNFGTKGVMKRNRGSFGGPMHPGGKIPHPIGAKYWNAHDREVFMKTSRPSPWAGRYADHLSMHKSSWRAERLENFERIHGPVPRGLQVRRLVPLCNCVDNLVLITQRVGALLNRGLWCRPPKRWGSIPETSEARFTAVLAAIAYSAAAERRKNLTRPCECGCGEAVKIHGNFNQGVVNNRFRPGHGKRQRSASFGNEQRTR